MKFRTLLALFSVLGISAAADNPEEPQARVHQAAVAFQEIMQAPDRGIPEYLLERAHCIAIIPAMKKAGFIVGGRYGVGVESCRAGAGKTWSGPSTVRVEGGSFGLQIGAGETDVVLLVMNEKGAEKLRSSKFTIGGEASAMAGPVGRDAKAETDAYMHAEILSYSRSRGVFAGVVLEGATLRPDNDANRALYGKAVTPTQILTGEVQPPAAARELISELAQHSPHETE